MSNPLNVVFRNKNDYITPLVVPETPNVKNYAWEAIGGCSSATLYIDNLQEYQMMEYLRLLRTPVEIRDDTLELVWYGYLNEVVLKIGNVTTGVSLNNMLNRIQVEYSYIEPGTQTVGQRQITAQVNDTISQGEFGIKEEIISLAGSTPTAAANRRDLELLRKKYPPPVTSLNVGSSPSVRSLTLNCKGWYSTLAWRKYNNTSTALTVTTTQIQNIITALNAFIISATIIDASGISTSNYRNDNNTALKEINDLLDIGTTAGRRLLAQVDNTRKLLVYVEPNSSSPLQLDQRGNLYNPTGIMLPKYKPYVGVYARLRDVFPAKFGDASVIDPTLVFIEQMEIDAATGARRFTFRDMLKLGDLGGVF